MSANPSCQNCIYRQPNERPEYSMSGTCHRFPPQIIPDAGWYFPGITPDDWCGEYREGDQP
jgi:hypothetical protein